jgi:hypothetical protein
MSKPRGTPSTPPAGPCEAQLSSAPLPTSDPLMCCASCGEVRRDYPDVIVKLRQTVQGTRTSLEDLRSGALDLALVSVPEQATAGLDLYPMHVEGIDFVCSLRHRLSGRKRVALSELVDEPFIDFPEGWGNRAIVDNSFAAAGLNRTVSTGGVLLHGTGTRAAGPWSCLPAPVRTGKRSRDWHMVHHNSPELDDSTGPLGHSAAHSGRTSADPQIQTNHPAGLSMTDRRRRQEPWGSKVLKPPAAEPNASFPHMRGFSCCWMLMPLFCSSA